MRLAFTLATVIFVTGCQPPPLTEHERRSLAKEAKELPLRERYALHEKIYARNQPPESFLASTVASGGQQAYIMATERLYYGSPSQIGAALEVIRETREAGLSCDPLDMRKVEANLREEMRLVVREVLTQIDRICYYGDGD